MTVQYVSKRGHHYGGYLELIRSQLKEHGIELLVCHNSLSAPNCVISAEPSERSIHICATVGNAENSNNCGLTEKQLQILKLIAAGYTNRRIASLMFLSISAVKWHIAQILERMHCEDRTKAAVMASKRGLI